MKNIILIISMSFVFISNAQSPILPLQGSGTRPVAGAYYKDTDNVFDKFGGTWKYINGNESFIIILQKKTLYYNPHDDTYLDIIIGEYSYNDSNGTEKVNTLDNLNNVNLNPYENNISGLLILDRSQPASLRRIELIFTDPERSYIELNIRLKYIAGSPERLELEWRGDMSLIPDDTSPTTIRVPEQNYILTKQP